MATSASAAPSSWSSKLASALDAAHAHSLVHRDVSRATSSSSRRAPTTATLSLGVAQQDALQGPDVDRSLSRTVEYATPEQSREVRSTRGPTCTRWVASSTSV